MSTSSSSSSLTLTPLDNSHSSSPRVRVPAPLATLIPPPVTTTTTTTLTLSSSNIPSTSRSTSTSSSCSSSSPCCVDILPKTGTGLPFSIPSPLHIYGSKHELENPEQISRTTMSMSGRGRMSTSTSTSGRTSGSGSGNDLSERSGYGFSGSSGSRGGSDGSGGLGSSRRRRIRNRNRNRNRNRSGNRSGSGGGSMSTTGNLMPSSASASSLSSLSSSAAACSCVPASVLISQYRSAQSQRIANPHLLLNRVVFDSIEPSPMHSGPQSPAVLSRRMTTTSATTAGYCFEHEEQTLIGPPGSGSSMASTLARARACVATGTSTSARPYYVPLSSDDTTLVFESRFENGNLRRAIQVYEFEYDLILKFDINTRGFTQWYYFRVGNVRKGQTVRFNVINLLKRQSLYNEGMKPLIYSVDRARRDNVGWFRGGSEIAYYRNHIKRSQRGFFYTLSFNYRFQEEGDHFFAYCFPYSFTQCKRHLNELERDPVRRRFIRRRTLCQSLAGNNVDVLTITSFSGDPRDLQRRKGVVLSARVHPGESNSSWMMKGAIDFLTGPSIDAQILRDNFVFRIVPMLNPDGVINGNYRTSLAGVDLNRRWDHPSKKLHPTIWHTKNMIRAFQEQREVVLFVDLHGHSRKKNIFMYGCSARAPDRKQKLKTRIFPRILWKVSKAFSFSDCSFNLSRKKEGSARIVGFKELGICNSFTMEASFCGASFGRYSDQHFTTFHLQEMGSFLCEAILDYRDPDQSMVGQVERELDLLYPSIENLTDDGEDDDSLGSDSDEDEPARKRSTPRKKRKKRKKKRGRVRKRMSHPGRTKTLNRDTGKTARNSPSASSSKKQAAPRKTGAGYRPGSRRPRKNHRLSIGAFETYRSFRNRFFQDRPGSSRPSASVYDVLSLNYETIIGVSDRVFVREASGIRPKANARQKSIRPRPTTGRTVAQSKSVRARPRPTKKKGGTVRVRRGGKKSVSSSIGLKRKKKPAARSRGPGPGRIKASSTGDLLKGVERRGVASSEGVRRLRRKLRPSKKVSVPKKPRGKRRRKKKRRE